MRALAILAAALALPLLCLGAQCTPGAAQPAPPPVSRDASVPVAVDAGVDVIAHRLCLDNFEQLNPGLTEAQIEDLFCATPEALAPWTRQAVINPSARHSDAGAH